MELSNFDNRNINVVQGAKSASIWDSFDLEKFQENPEQEK